MKISDIVQLISLIDPAAPFTFSKETTGGMQNVADLLNEIFQTSSLSLTDISILPVDNGITLKATAKEIFLLDCHLLKVPVELRFAQGDDDFIRFAVKVTPDENFQPLAELCELFGIRIDNIIYCTYNSDINPFVRGGISAMFHIKELTLPIFLEFPFQTDKRTFAMKSEALSDYKLPIEDIFALLHIDIALFPTSLASIIHNISIRELEIEYDTKLKTLSRINIGLNLQQETAWTIFSGFQISNLKIDIRTALKITDGEKSVREADFIFKGTLILNNLSVPVGVFLFSGNQYFIVQIHDDSQPIPLQKLDLLTQFTGAYDFTSILPQTLKPETLKPGLDNLLIQFDCNSFSLLNFNISIAIAPKWNILGLFDVDRLSLLYSLKKEKDKSVYDLLVKGELQLSDLLLSLSAHKALEGGWTFEGHANGGQGILLNKLLNDLNKMLSLPALPLPDIYLYHISINYQTQKEQFRLKAKAVMAVDGEGFPGFRELGADFEVCFTKELGKWKFEGNAVGELELFASRFQMEYTVNTTSNLFKLNWKPTENDAFSIINFCHALGFQDFSLPAGLNLTCKSASIYYDFKSGLFKLNAETNLAKNLLLCSLKPDKSKNDREYIFILDPGMELSFSDLPVVGTALPGMDKYGIKNLLIVASTTDISNLPDDKYKELKLNKGFLMGTDLILPDDIIPIRIPFASYLPPEKHTPETLIEANNNTAGSDAPGFLIDVQKSIGPFNLQKLGATYANKSICFSIDASFDGGGLMFSLDGLSAGYNLEEKRPVFGLSGLSVNVKTGAFSIGGGFLRQDEYTYAGNLLLQLGPCTLTAVGAYTSQPSRSIFAFAFLKANIGGPPCFFITGIAAGFGYNRDLNIPDINELENFPLLKVALGETQPSELIRKERTLFPVKDGAYWIAAGVLFNSFKMIDSVAILTARFGYDVEINLLGKSVLNIPFNSPSTPVAHAELLLKATIRPADSLVAVEAVLSDNSYILSKDCHLSGGFAFYMWYGGKHAGDFVVTLGGYHQRYKKPAHYPAVKRLALNWKVSKELSAKGEIYFALTPSCLMAGGRFEMVFTTSIVRAWFSAYFDMLIQWKPYYYDLQVGIHIGVAVNLRLFTIRVELGCDLHIWGPEFSGIAHIHLWIITFSIKFGAGAPQRAPVISWEEFTKTFLPSKTADANRFGGCSIQAAAGVINEYKKPDGTVQWSMCAEELELTTKSLIPGSEVKFNNAPVGEKLAALHVQPCKLDNFSACHTVILQRKDKLKIESEFDLTPIYENVPTALWGANNSGETLLTRTGLRIKPQPVPYYEITFMVDCHQSDKKCSWKKAEKIALTEYKDQEKSYEFIRRIDSSDTIEKRNTLLHTLGLDTTDISMNKLGQHPELFFVEHPMLRNIGGNKYD